MTRARFYDVSTDPAGRPVPGVTVNVYITGTTTPLPQTIYAAATGGATRANPFVTSTGVVDFWLEDPAVVDLKYTIAGYGTQTQTVEVVEATPPATAVTVTPVGGLVATTAQAALAELDTETADRVRGSVRLTVDELAPSSPAVDDLWLDADASPTGSYDALYAALGHAHSGTYERLHTINVKAYGALGNGSANDTAAINAAIAALTAGDTLYFPPGRYMTDGGHVIDTPSIIIRGSSGRAQTYNSSAQLYLRSGANATMLTLAAGTNQVTIRDLALYGNHSNQTGTSHGLVIDDDCNYFLLDAVWVDSFHDDGLVVGQTSSGTQSGTITNCESRVNQGYGMKFNGAATDTIVSQSYIDQNGHSGVYCSAADISFTECHIWGNGTTAEPGTRLDGMTFVSSAGCRIVNCYIETNTEGAGIRFATGTLTGHLVMGCDIWSNGFQGITAFAAVNLSLVGNTIRQNNFKSQAGRSGAGVDFEDCTSSLVSGNQFWGPSPFRQTYGYYETGACSNGLFANNVCRAAVHGTGDIVISTAGAVRTIVRGNVGPLDDPPHAQFGGSPILPTGALGQTINRLGPGGNLTAKTSGTLTLVAVNLPAGVLCTSITFISRTTALVAGTNQWFGLFNSARVPLRLTVDDTSTAWGANTAKTLALSSTFTTTYSGLYYLGVLVAAGTVPTLVGLAGSSGLTGIVPIITGASSTGLTDPASCPNPAGAITASGDIPYAYVS